LIQQIPSECTAGTSLVELPQGHAKVRVAVTRQREKLIFDFSGTSAQHGGQFNAVRAITVSAVFYAVRCLIPDEIPTTAGLLDSVEVVTEPGSLVDALHPAAVAAGNVETSQRIVLAIFEALSRLLPGRVPAAAQGTMNNLLVGGVDPRTDSSFTYYETIAGGHGGGPAGPGLSARHSHMTNSLNTPVEALEHSYPLRINKYAIRRGSGGRGETPGGEGIVREVEFTTDAEFTLLRQSCEQGPSGAQGGMAGAAGKAVYVSGGSNEILPASQTRKVNAGDRLVIATPGGGGWGRLRQ
jgi:N-methylhydantoinase B